MGKATGKGDKGFKSWQALAAAFITAAAAIIAALIMRPFEGVRANQSGILEPQKISRITGRIVNADTRETVTDAKVSLEVSGLAPLLRYPDSEGTFDFALPADATNVNIRVESKGYDTYTRRVNVSALSGIEEIRLEPRVGRTKNPPPAPAAGEVARDVPAAAASLPARGTAASEIDETLRPITGSAGPWGVVIFGEGQDRRSDVQSWVRSALAGSGHDTVSLFRKMADEQRLAPDLYRGSAELFTRLRAGRFVSRLVVGKLAVIVHGTTEGLTVAEAKLAVHVLSPEGDLLTDFELSEKGSGLDPDSARRNAIDELQTVIQRELPAAL